MRWAGMDVEVVRRTSVLSEAGLKSDTDVNQRIIHTLLTLGYDPQELRRALAPLPQEKAARIMRSLEFSII